MSIGRNLGSTRTYQLAVRIFYFLAFFFIVFHKYVNGGKISESGLLAQRHRCWRRANTSRRQRPWRRALGLGTNVEVTWYWRRARRQGDWRRACVLTPAPTFLPEASTFSFSSISGFFSPHFVLPHESVYWALKNLIWFIDLREQGILASLLIFFAPIRYILVIFLNLRIIIT